MIYLLNKIRLFILKNIYQNYNMGIFCFDKLSFVVGLGITLLLCGLIMFYVKQRFSVYDRAITEQSQLLKYLVSSIQSGPSISSDSISAPGAVEEAKRIHNSLSSFGGNDDKRIVVSDDENDSESETESDSDMESDSETESDSDAENDTETESGNDGSSQVPQSYQHKSFSVNPSVLVDDEKLNIKQINLSNENIKVVNVDNLRLTNEQSVNLVNELLSHLENHDEMSLCNEDKCINIQEVNFDHNDESVTDKTSSVDNLDNMLEKKKYIDLSKTQLQELCKERNLSFKGSKKDLIDRLME